MELMLGDCREKLKVLPDNSVDAVVTDPPYHLTTGKNSGSGPKSLNTNSPAGRSRVITGFMGKAWDGGDIAQDPEFWMEVLRVLKPGGHLLAFGGTRTSHRMVCAIEDAGFEIRDSLSWVYGCLDFESEIYTDRGWQTHDTIHPNDRVLQFDKCTERYSFSPIQKIYHYVITDTCYRIQSDYTDQLVSRNHRCLVEREGELVFMFAENARQQETVPYLESLPGVSQTLRSGASYRTTLATITPIEYRGIVWCVGVETGVFVARRYGKIFITGNIGFPKSMDISKALDKKSGVDREDKFEGSFDRFAGPTGNRKCDECGKWLVSGSPCQCPRPQDEPQSDAAKQWDGWGTALKPAHEPICLARKPLSEKTVAQNVLQWGTGALNIDGCRIPTESRPLMTHSSKNGKNSGEFRQQPSIKSGMTNQGRFPANLIHDGSEEILACFPVTKSGAMKHEVGGYDGESTTGFLRGRSGPSNQHGDSGSAARFFYCAKASKKDRNAGLPNGATNKHPTVKPESLMKYLCRLITPPGGIVLDPFMGSGSTGRAARLEGFDFIGIEQDPESFETAQQRIESVQKERQPLF